jgi:hypothetical protein
MTTSKRKKRMRSKRDSRFSTESPDFSTDPFFSFSTARTVCPSLRAAGWCTSPPHGATQTRKGGSRDVDNDRNVDSDGNDDQASWWIERARRYPGGLRRTPLLRVADRYEGSNDNDRNGTLQALTTLKTRSSPSGIKKGDKVFQSPASSRVQSAEGNDCAAARRAPQTRSSGESRGSGRGAHSFFAMPYLASDIYRVFVFDTAKEKRGLHVGLSIA